MTRVVALIDYGSGNLRSAEKALLRAASMLARPATIITTHDHDVIAKADAVVLPGVGAFAACMDGLAAADGALAGLRAAVRERGAPFLGICVGMQLLASRGLEHGASPGLDWIGGDVERLHPETSSAKVPHVGWNAVNFTANAPLFMGLPAGVPMYFTHSYAFAAKDLCDVVAWADHGGRFAAAVTRDNLAGVQFHPEKSQAAGLSLLTNFLEWRP